MHKRSGLLITRILLLVSLLAVAVFILADAHQTNQAERDSDTGSKIFPTDVPSDEAPTEQVTAEIDPVSIEAGELIANESCVACHGTDGNANIATNGNLAGQNKRYLYEQLVLIREKIRPITTMDISVQDLDNDALLSLAMYYESLPGRIGQSNPEQDLELGKSIYRGGILDKKVAACTACHSPNGNGNSFAGFPRISGQTVQYLEAQLKAYREGERTTDEDYGGMMRDIAKKLTDGEISAVANYMTGLY